MKSTVVPASQGVWKYAAAVLPSRAPTMSAGSVASAMYARPATYSPSTTVPTSLRSGSDERPADHRTWSGSTRVNRYVVIPPMRTSTGSTHERNTPSCGATATKAGSSAILAMLNEVFSTGTQKVARRPISAASWIEKTTHSATAATKNRVGNTPGGMNGQRCTSTNTPATKSPVAVDAA